MLFQHISNSIICFLILSMIFLQENISCHQDHLHQRITNKPMNQIKLQAQVLVEDSVPNCEIQQSKRNQRRCIRCKSGYILSTDGATCLPNLKQLENCVQVGVFHECLVCDCGYGILISIQQCVSLPRQLHGCQLFNEEEICLKPKEKFQLVIENLTSAANAGTVEFSYGTNCEINFNYTCIRCHHGYKLTSMHTCVKHAKELVNSQYSYFEGDELKSRDMRFIALRDGVYVTIQNCITHTLVSSSTESSDQSLVRCTECIGDRIPNESETSCYKRPFELCGRVKDSNPWECSICNPNERYYLLTIPDVGMNCIPRRLNNYDGCLKYFEKSDACEICRIPFILHRTSCIPNYSLEEHHQIPSLMNLQSMPAISYCEIYDEYANCFECKEGFTLTTKGTCVVEVDKKCLITHHSYSTRAIQMMGGIQSVHEQHGCYQCIPGFQFSEAGGFCSQMIGISCYYFDKQLKRCLQCESGYYLNKDFQCIWLKQCSFSNGVDDICYQCVKHFQLHKSEGDDSRDKCVQIDHFDDCLLSDGITNRCIQCNSSHFLLENGTCESRVRHHNGQCEYHGHYIELTTNGNVVEGQSSTASPEETYCKKHSKYVASQCLKFDPNSNRCLKCYDTSSYLDVVYGNCVGIFGCKFHQPNRQECIQAESSYGYIDPIDKKTVKELTCLTNRIDAICVRFDEAGSSVLVSQLIDSETGEVIEKFEDSQFPRETSLNCFIMQRIRSNQKGNSSVYEYRCMKCLSQFFPDVLGVCQPIEIPNCNLSNGLEKRCLHCDAMNSVDESNGMCISNVEKVNRCVRMEGFRCKQCESLFFPVLNGQFCEPISNSKCVISNGIVDACECSSVGFSLTICQFIFCEEVYQDTGRCKKCLPGYTMIEDSSKKIEECVKIQIRNCKSQKDPLSCEECEEGYYKNTTKVKFQSCQKIMIPNCIRMKDNQFACVECADGYFVSAKGSCLQIPNCASFTHTCTSCNPPYILTRFGRCELIQNCVVISGNTCIQCESTYYPKIHSNLANSYCTRIPNCLHSQGFDSDCDICQDFFIRVAYRCIAVIPIDHCEEYEKEECTKCDNLFYLASDRKRCLKISEAVNCARSNGITDECESCEINGYVLNVSERKACELFLNCEITNGITLCLFCKKSYYLLESDGSFTCTSRPMISNCAFYDSNTPQCQECESLFYLSEDRSACIAISIHPRYPCFFSSGKLNSCMVCNAKLPQTAGADKISRPRQDSYEWFYERCEYNKLYPNYKLSCPPNDYNYYSEDSYLRTRLRCYPRTNDQFEESCVEYEKNSSGCAKCRSGFLLVDGDSKELLYESYCSRIPAVARVKNCEIYETNTSICLECKQSKNLDILEFILDRNANACVSVLAKKCSFDIHREGAASLADQQLLGCGGKNSVGVAPRCLERSKSDRRKCKICRNGYFNRNGECEKHAYLAKCERYSLVRPNACEICETGYFVYSRECEVMRIQYCDIAYFTDLQCLQCMDGYAFDVYVHSLCVESKFPNCNRIGVRQNDQVTNCRSCKRGFIFDEEQNCVRKNEQVDLNCDIFQLERGDSPRKVCKKCLMNYFLSVSSNSCLEQESECAINSCEVYSEEDSLPDQYSCAKCSSGFQVDPNFQHCVPIVNGEQRDGDERNKYPQKQSEEETKNYADHKNKEETQNDDSISDESRSLTALVILILILFILSCLGLIMRRFCDRQKRRQNEKEESDQNKMLSLNYSVSNEMSELELGISDKL